MPDTLTAQIKASLHWLFQESLDLATVPTVYLVKADGAIETRTEGFQRQPLEESAARLGAQAPFFLPTDKAPVLRPG